MDRNECYKFIINGHALPGSAEETGNLWVRLWASKMIVRPNEWYSSSMQVSSHSLDLGRETDRDLDRSRRRTSIIRRNS
jgi:hypothetical protein